MKSTLLCIIGISVSILASSRTHQTALPVMGWSSWNTYRININDELIKKQADALVELGLKDAGYRYVNIDDGFFGYRDDDGNLHTHPERFPDGLGGLTAYIHSLGLKAGVYSDAGANTCGSIWDSDPNGVGVGLYGHEEQDADLYFNKWDFDYIKIDYCGAGQQLDLDERERYTTICDAIRRVRRRPVSINICRWAFPGTWAGNLAGSWRISSDITLDWNSVKYIVSKNLYLSAFARGGHYNDMDILEIGRGLTPEEEETHFGLWCIMSSPLIIGCDLTAVPENCAEWDCVYSRTGGAYRMTISYLPPETGRLEVNDRRLEVTVNGHPYPVPGSLVKDRAQGICTVSLDVALKPGENVVRIGSRYTWTPDIDCFSLERL